MVACSWADLKGATPTQTIKAGTLVRIKDDFGTGTDGVANAPRHGWGGISSKDTGIVVSMSPSDVQHDFDVVVEFKGRPRWYGLLSELQFVRGKDTDSHWYWEMLLCWPCFLMDAFIVPVAVLVIGSLFLCTSRDPCDVILNSCGVAFIADLDNLLLLVLKKCEDLRVSGSEVTVRVPYMPRLARGCVWTMCYIPIVPVGLSAGFMHLGQWMNL